MSCDSFFYDISSFCPKIYLILFIFIFIFTTTIRYIREVHCADKSYIAIKLDTQAIQNLHLNVDAHTLRYTRLFLIFLNNSHILFFCSISSFISFHCFLFLFIFFSCYSVLVFILIYCHLIKCNEI